VAAKRSRSIAVSVDHSVYQWGFVGEEGHQFMKLCTLPGPCKQVEIGLEFNLFLLENGDLFYFGTITQEGEDVLDSMGELIQLEPIDDEQNPVRFKTI